MGRLVLSATLRAHGVDHLARYRTRLGIRVGSTVEALRRAYPHGEMSGGVYMVPPQSYHGTLYTVRAGRVREIEVWLSGDSGQ